MKSQTFAFNFAQQQAVLNFYYGQMKPASAGPFDPKSTTDCGTYRDARKEVEKGMNGMQRAPEPARTQPLYSEGR